MRIEDEIKQSKFKDPQIKAMLNIVFTANWWNAKTAAVMKPFGISPQQYNILRILRGSHPTKLSVLSIKERMLDKTPNTTRLVDKLLAKDLVGRKRCENDRRVVYISITEAGLQLLKEIDENVKEMDAKSSMDLTDEEAETLSRLLDKMRK
ncbi:MarR family transcriptional regulator [Limibacter armeniacum]|uniref:MarR family winged helix-turn-helix transcriptional regulator n=1 Tax=Limibacter armeniacum TaxID=466084 RepID=UPI002FE51C2B